MTNKCVICDRTGGDVLAYLFEPSDVFVFLCSLHMWFSFREKPEEMSIRDYVKLQRSKYSGGLK